MTKVTKSVMAITMVQLYEAIQHMMANLWSLYDPKQKRDQKENSKIQGYQLIPYYTQIKRWTSLN